jgi:hypothetical protein
VRGAEREREREGCAVAMPKLFMPRTSVWKGSSSVLGCGGLRVQSAEAQKEPLRQTKKTDVAGWPLGRAGRVCCCNAETVHASNQCLEGFLIAPRAWPFADAPLTCEQYSVAGACVSSQRRRRRSHCAKQRRQTFCNAETVHASNQCLEGFLIAPRAWPFADAAVEHEPDLA